MQVQSMQQCCITDHDSIWTNCIGVGKHHSFVLSQYFEDLLQKTDCLKFSVPAKQKMLCGLRIPSQLTSIQNWFQCCWSTKEEIQQKHLTINKKRYSVQQ